MNATEQRAHLAMAHEDSSGSRTSKHVRGLSRCLEPFVIIISVKGASLSLANDRAGVSWTLELAAKATPAKAVAVASHHLVQPRPSYQPPDGDSKGLSPSQTHTTVVPPSVYASLFNPIRELLEVILPTNDGLL